MEKDFAETSNMLKTIVDYANAVKKVISYTRSCHYTDFLMIFLVFYA